MPTAAPGPSHQRRRILVGSLDVVPAFRKDQVQPDVGCPQFEMTLQNGNVSVTLRGILRENRARCRVLEFAEELGNTTGVVSFIIN